MRVDEFGKGLRSKSWSSSCEVGAGSCWRANVLRTTVVDGSLEEEEEEEEEHGRSALKFAKEGWPWGLVGWWPSASTTTVESPTSSPGSRWAIATQKYPFYVLSPLNTVKET